MPTENEAKICKNCKFWKIENSEAEHMSLEDYEKLGIYDGHKSRMGLGRCHKAVHLIDATKFAKEDSIDKTKHKILAYEDDGDEDDPGNKTYLIELDVSQKLYVTDASDYMAHLYTKSDFFCAHYTSKA